MYEHEPLFIVDYYDKKYDVNGWFVVDALINGVTGGGIRMRKGLNVEEVVHLAQKMTLKFTFLTPLIGGAKCGLDYDVFGRNDPGEKKEVLQRFLRFLEPCLRSFYVTGPDINTTGTEIMQAVGELGINHPQYALARKSPMGEELALKRLNEGVNIPVEVLGSRQILNDVTSGFSVMEAAKTACFLDGSSFEDKRVAIEGFGAVGGSAAHFIAQEGATIVAISDRDGAVWCDNGVDVQFLNTGERGLLRRDSLPDSYCVLPNEEGGIYEIPVKADLFIPAARSDTITIEKIEKLLKNIQPEYVIPGANHPFVVTDADAEGYHEQILFEEKVIVIPDFIANAGAAALFGILTWNEDVDLTADSLLRAIAVMIRESTVKVMASSESEGRNPLEVSLAQSRKRIVEYYTDYSSKF